MILSHCPFVDGTAEIGIRLSVAVSMLAAPGPSQGCHMMQFSGLIQ